MQQITFTNTRGESVTIGGREPFLLNSIDGLGDMEAENQTQTAPYRDGFIPLDTIFRERVISITATLIADEQHELHLLRKKLSRVFNPKLGEGTLIYEDGFQIKMIRGKADSIPTFPSGNDNRTPNTQKTSISITCSNPYWKDLKEVSRALSSYVGKFKLPTTFPIEFGIEGDSTILWNNGDVETPVMIDIQGPVVNPKVINRTTNQFIQLNRSLSDDEVLHINTGTPRRVELYRDGKKIENAMGYLDHYSDFWELAIGANEIQYISDAGSHDATVAISWQNYYVGI